MIRLLHSSDLHLGSALQGGDYLEYAHGMFSALTGPPALETEVDLFCEVLGERASKVRALVISGDLSHTGSVWDLSVAKGIVDDISSNARTGEFSLVPGNHDRYSEGSFAPAAPEVFDGLFEHYWCGGRGLKQVEIVKDPAVCMILIDFSLRSIEDSLREGELFGAATSEVGLEGSLGVLGCGRCYPDLVAELVEVTAARQMEGWAVFWVIHFAPRPRHISRWKQSTLRLLGEGLVVQAANDLGVRLLLCGHVHKEKIYSIGDLRVVCAGRGIRNSAQSTASFYELELEQVGGSVVLRDCWKYERFVDSGGYVGPERLSWE